MKNEMTLGKTGLTIPGSELAECGMAGVDLSAQMTHSLLLLITKLRGDELPPVDIICGGSPCQDLSVAGARAGLAGERSGLFMEQIRIITSGYSLRRQASWYPSSADWHCWATTTR